MGRFAFAKYEGLGNDFVVLEVADPLEVSAGAARSLCDRRRGVGADGVLLLLPPREPASAARMKVINADGSVPEMCGNGLRCVALHVARARGIANGELVLETDAGARSCVVDDRDGVGIVTVDMGVVRNLGSRTIDVDGEAIVVWLADAGNPHAIVFGDSSRARAEAIGPKIERHATFAKGTNVEFARVEPPARIDLVVWERGVGITLACGTGACATVAAACARGAIAPGQRVTVRLPGGELDVTIDEAGQAVMRGPARHVFSGQLAT